MLPPRFWRPSQSPPHLHLRGPLELQAQQRHLRGVPEDEGLQFLLVHLAVRAADDGLHGGLHALHQALQPDLDVALGLHRSLKRHALALAAEHRQHLGAVRLKGAGGVWREVKQRKAGQSGATAQQATAIPTAQQAATQPKSAATCPGHPSLAACLARRPLPLQLRALSKVTLDRESKRPDWK